MKEKVFLEISQNLQKNTCEFCEISKNTFLTEHVWATASDFRIFSFVIILTFTFQVYIW